MGSSLIGNLLVKIVTLLLGLILFLPSSYKLYTYCIFRYSSTAVYGTIEKPMQSRDIGNRPFIVFKDTQGKEHEFRSKAKTNWFFANKKGDEIKVLFLKNDPQQAIVDSVFYYIVLPISFCCMGGLLVFYVFKEGWREFKAYRCNPR